MAKARRLVVALAVVALAGAAVHWTNAGAGGVRRGGETTAKHPGVGQSASSPHGPARRSNRPAAYAVGSPRTVVDGDPATGEFEERSRRLRAARRTFASLRDDPGKTDFHLELMERMKESHRHPPGNRRFVLPTADPVRARYAPERRSTRAPDASARLTVWAEQTYLPVGETLRIRALLETAVPGASVPDQLSLSIASVSGGTVATDASSLERQADGYAVEIDTTGWRPGTFQARIEVPGGPQESIAIMLVEQKLQFLGKYRDRIEDGDLVVEALVRVLEGGAFHVRSTLYADEQTAIGLSESNHRLDAGEQWVTMRFHGLLLHRSGRQGPYLLRYLTSAERTMPPRWHGLVTADHWTGEYELSRFSRSPYQRLDPG